MWQYNKIYYKPATSKISLSKRSLVDQKSASTPGIFDKISALLGGSPTLQITSNLGELKVK